MYQTTGLWNWNMMWQPGGVVNVDTTVEQMLAIISLTKLLTQTSILLTTRDHEMFNNQNSKWCLLRGPSMI